MRLRYYSKGLFKLMNKSSLDGFKTEEMKLGFVCGIIDAEGSYNPLKSTISINNTNLALIDTVKRYLNCIGYQVSIK